ncbi:MAG: type III pantothenate kinase [bacterium]
MNKAKFLAIDAGNSSVKVGVFDGLRDISTKITQQYDKLDFSSLKSAGAGGAIIASVVPSKNSLITSELKKINIEKVFWIDNRTNLGFKVIYDPQDAIGADRLALMSGAYYFYVAINKKPALAVSCGSAITVNLIDENGYFKGGAILPGAMLMANALSNLELLKQQKLEAFESDFQYSTSKAINSGISAAIKGAIETFARRAENATLILAGSYALQIAQALEMPCVVDIDLALKGLAMIYLLEEAGFIQILCG